MSEGKGKIKIAVTRSGGIMAQKLEFKQGLSMSEKDWDELRLLNTKERGKENVLPDGFLFKLSFCDKSVVLTEEQLPVKWRKKLQSMDL
jgi:hypothetical protein